MRSNVRLLLQPVARFFGGVRVRMTLWYLAILALVFVIFGGIVSAIAVQNEQYTERESVRVLSTQLLATYDGASNSLNVTDPWGTVQSKPTQVKQLRVDGSPFSPQDVAVLLDANGTVTQRFGPLTDQSVAALQTLVLQPDYGTAKLDQYPTLQLPITTFGGGLAMSRYVLYISPITYQQRHVATLIVGRISDPTHPLSALVPGLLIAGPLTLLVAALGGYWLATRALRPVRLIARAAEEIEETDLSRRLNLKARDELGALAATFDRMLARLEAAFARQRQFTGDASHELRTPLSIVVAEVERALAAPRAPEEYRRALEVIQSENAYMGQLVGQLLTLARADAGQPRLRDEPLDLSDVALEVVERLAPLAGERGVVLSTGALPELRVRGDRAALGLSLGNLVENAIKYAGRAGQAESGHVHVETGAADRGDGRHGRVAWVRVEDDGAGIAAEHLPHLFERFYRVDAARTHDAAQADEKSGGAPDGSGLGLAIAHEIARAHGGTIRVESAVGCGSAFTLELPTC